MTIRLIQKKGLTTISKAQDKNYRLCILGVCFSKLGKI